MRGGLTRLALIAALVGACTGSGPAGDRPVDVPTLVVRQVEADTVLPGTEILIHGSGFVPPQTGTPMARFRSATMDLGGVPTRYVSDQILAISMDGALIDALGGAGKAFSGEVQVTYAYEGTTRTQSAAVPATFEFRDSLPLRVDGTTSTVLYLGSALRIQGSGFLHPSEGGTHVTLQGTFTPDGGAPRSILVVEVATLRSRSEAEVLITPEVFGIAPGQFTGTIAVRTTPLRGQAASVAASALDLILGPAAVLDVTATVRRGQRLVIRGRGFLPTVPAESQTTIVRFDGDFTERGGKVVPWRGDTALEIVPEYDAADQLSYVLRVFEQPNGDLDGLGLVSGTFEGRLTPTLYRGAEVIEGLPLTVKIQIEPVRQVIFLKYLPGFTDTLREIGLRNVELEVRQRIRAVVERDYSQWNVEFREVRPTDYVEYGVVEVGGVDPNRRGLFGLDNTTGKDLGNLRLNDVIGGFNAETQEQGYLAFGGVFLESFLALSPRHPEPLPIASERFDAIFDPFRSDRGGRAVEAGEYPDSPRQAQIAEAIRVLGNLVGSTVTHEIGHTLGMATEEGFFHNPVPGPNQIMDSGGERPFEERAEIDGRGPATFSVAHRAYLDGILPR